MSVLAQQNQLSGLQRVSRWLIGRWWRIPLLVVALALLLPLLLTLWVHIQTADRIYDNTDSVAKFDAGLLLGTSRYVRGGVQNLYFVNRIKATVALYKAGKIRKVIISGDNKHVSYNEPREMYRALVKGGVAPEDIVWDFAGFRTFDSVVRARKVFGQQRLLIVSQRGHAQRAMFIADYYGIDAWGYPAANPPNESLWMKLREPMARIKAFADLYLLGTEPKHLGEPVSIFKHNSPDSTSQSTDDADQDSLPTANVQLQD